LALITEKKWKLLISGAICCGIFGYFAFTGSTPRILR